MKILSLDVLLADIPLLKDEPLARFTAARMGGAADWVYVAKNSSAELAHVIKTAWDAKIPVRVLGGGANVLISDNGVRGLVVVNRLNEIAFDADRVTVSGGTSLTVLGHKCQSNGLRGFAWAVSVPGTVGGAVVNNAGAHKSDMAALLVEAHILDAEQGEITLTNADLAYSYRTSSLKKRTDRRFLVLSAMLQLHHDDPAAIKTHMDENIAYRKRTQPTGASLGSIFKNPEGDYAGRLIEACNLKGYRVGGAQVSPVHANFFINTGKTTASDYYALIQHVRTTVQAQTGILLEPEIELIGEWDGAP